MLRGVADEVAGWRVEEHRLLEPAPDDDRSLRSVVAVVRRPEGPGVPATTRGCSAGSSTTRRWPPRTPRRSATCRTSWCAAVTRDAPAVHAIVEEMTDGGDADPARRVTRLVESVATIGADRDLDLVPTSRCVLDLTGSGPA